MSRQPVKVYFPKTRLMELIRRSGGITADEAIKNAIKFVEEVRGVSIEGVESAIAELEGLIPQATGGKFSEQQMKEILRKTERVVTLAGTFGYPLLQEVGMRLCDLADGMARQKLGDIAPIAVHIRALRLMAPASRTLSEEEYAKILDELEKVLNHFNCERTAVPEDFSAAELETNHAAGSRG